MEYILPEVLENDPHLPITKNMSSQDAIPLINSFYSTNFARKDFKETFAYQSKEGQLRLDLVSVNEDISISFLNHSSKAVNVITTKLVNPLKKEGLLLLERPLEVLLKEELDFLKDYRTDYSFSRSPNERDKDTLEQLRNLLNNYSYLGPWYVGDLHSYSLLGLKVIHNGDCKDLPNGFKLPKCKRVVVLELTSGFTKGKICLLVR